VVSNLQQLAVCKTVTGSQIEQYNQLWVVDFVGFCSFQCLSGDRFKLSAFQDLKA